MDNKLPMQSINALGQLQSDFYDPLHIHSTAMPRNLVSQISLGHILQEQVVVHIIFGGIVKFHHVVAAKGLVNFYLVLGLGLQVCVMLVFFMSSPCVRVQAQIVPGQHLQSLRL